MNCVQTLGAGWAQLAAHRGALGRALIGPSVLLVLLAVLWARGLGAPAQAAAGFMIWYALTVMAISVHRIVLIGSQAVPRCGLWVLAEREGLFVRGQIFCAIGVGVLLGGLALATAHTGFWGDDASLVWTAIALAAPLAYLASRVALIFPAASTGQAWSLRDAWRASREHQWCLLGLVGLWANCANVLALWALDAGPLEQAMCGLLLLGAGVVFVAALSVAFRDISLRAPLQSA